MRERERKALGFVNPCYIVKESLRNHIVWKPVFFFHKIFYYAMKKARKDLDIKN
jgi:hypothetical protein